MWSYEQMVYAQLNICLGEWSTQTLMGFWHTNGSFNLSQTTRPYNNQQKKRTCKIVSFAVPADDRVELKEHEKKYMYLDLARELKKLRKMKVTIIPIVISALGTVAKGLVKALEDFEIRGQVETIQTTTLMRSTRIRILRRVLETLGDLLSL